MRKRIALEDILKPGSNYARHALRRRLVEENRLSYICAMCGNDGSWQGKQLSLHLDHINGVYNDNSIHNLRFLCPNCHAQTETYAGKNIQGKCKSLVPKINMRKAKLEADKAKWESLKPSIDFSKRGWVNEVAAILHISPQKVNRWILRVAPTDHANLYK